MLCDAGPLVALIDADDPSHSRCYTAAASLPATMRTTWPCFTEAMYLVHRAGGIKAQSDLWSYVSHGVLQLYLPQEAEWHRMHELMIQYADMPLDLADASLVSAAEQLKDYHLFSLDSSLRAIRLHGRRSFVVVP